MDNNKVIKINPVEIKNTSTDGHARKMGRMCCGGRCMTIKTDSEVKDAMFIEQSDFKGYKCMINWFFLHIEQDRDAVYHHQTCMGKLKDSPDANIDKEKFGDIANKFNADRGPITTISEGDKYLEWLEQQFIEGKTPVMTCPNNHCGCGICIAKANNDQDFQKIASKYISVGELC